MTVQELQEQIDLYQRIMDGCGDPEHSFTLVDAVQGKEPSQKYLDFQALVEKAGLETGFFDISDPLFVRAERKRNLYQEILDEKKLLHRGISVA